MAERSTGTQAAAAAMIVALALAAGAHVRAQGGGRFEDADYWAEVFDRPGRDAWQKPEEVMRALAIAPDAKVADIGAGTGYFTVRLARAVPRGRVYAVDTEPAMVSHLRERVARERLTNVEVVLGSRASPQLPAAVDVVLLVNVQGLMADPRDYFRDLKPSLNPGARIGIISTRPEASRGPRSERRVPPEQVKRDMARQGYALVGEHDFIADRYFLVFTPGPP